MNKVYSCARRYHLLRQGLEPRTSPSRHRARFSSSRRVRTESTSMLQNYVSVALRSSLRSVRSNFSVLFYFFNRRFDHSSRDRLKKKKFSIIFSEDRLFGESLKVHSGFLVFSETRLSIVISFHRRKVFGTLGVAVRLRVRCCCTAPQVSGYRASPPRPRGRAIVRGGSC